MTNYKNYERLKNMTLEEMAKFFANMKPKGCGLCMGAYMGCLREVSCSGGIKDWLKSDKSPRLMDEKFEWTSQ